jgi:hypothetical protein
MRLQIAPIFRCTGYVPGTTTSVRGQSQARFADPSWDYDFDSMYASQLSCDGRAWHAWFEFTDFSGTVVGGANACTIVYFAHYPHR